MQETNYGIQRPGQSQFVIVAPHSAGDDLKSGLVAKCLARQLQASLVINYRYLKPKNSRATNHCDQVEDFNKLRWSNKKQKYLWAKKKPAMHEFFQDIERYAELAKQFSWENKAVIIYIHSLNKVRVGVDIGAGLKSYKGNHFEYSFKDKKNYGKATVKINQLKLFKSLLEPDLKKIFNLKVSVGQVHTGWSRSSAIQFHKHEGRNDYALQLEIGKALRTNTENIQQTANILAQALRATFPAKEYQV